MNIGIIVYRIDSLTYTIAKAISFDGHQVFIYVKRKVTGRNDFENRFISRLNNIPGLSIISQFDKRLCLDWSYFKLHSHLTRKDMAPWAKISKHIAIISRGDKNNDYLKAWKCQLQEWFRFYSIASKAERILFKDGYYQQDLWYFLSKRRTLIGFDVHSQFLDDPELFHFIFNSEWSAEAERPILVNFMGDQNPSNRLEILNMIRAKFNKPLKSKSTVISKNINKKMYWVEYGDKLDSTGVSGNEFVDVLTQSDFTICPPGYSRITHRPIEALLRGSIPIINAEELEFYAMDLHDKVNCIAVKNNDWSNALEQIMRMEGFEIINMRKNIKQMKDTYLEYSISSHQMRSRMGLIENNIKLDVQVS